MKKIKRNNHKVVNIPVHKPDVKCSRITISSRICNQEKFNELFQLLDHTTAYKNLISNHCFKNITSLVTDYHLFITQYKNFTNLQLNSWESQNIFQDICSHYFETAQRYLSKAKFVVTNAKTNISNIAIFINYHSNLTLDNQKYILHFNVCDKLQQLSHNIDKYNADLLIEKDKFHRVKLEKNIATCHNLIAKYKEIEDFSIHKPKLYHRLIKLITTKKLRLLTKVKLSIYKTGTHARNLSNAQMSIIEDLTNGKYQYFLKIRKLSTLVGREPKNKDVNNITNNPYQQKLLDFNEKNFIYLPLIFNSKKLNSIGKNIKNILTKDNPQVLIKSEQLRIGQSSRKIHIIFNYEEQNKLGTIIDHSFKNNIDIKPNDLNTLGLDVNCKNNLLADSNGIFYDEIIKNKEINKSKFINNVNEIVILNSKPIIERTEKEIYRYQKLLRTNESLLKTYLSGLIKNWKLDNILHLVLEDLNITNDKTYYEHKGIKIKYSRLSRLLRFGKIKYWISGMAEKQGLFTHIVNPAYTSQECNKCHYISPNNRHKQEEFICKNPDCNHEENADSNAAKCIKNRILNRNIRNKLGKDNVYQCSRTKPINYKIVKSIINEEYKLGVITELFPFKFNNLKSKKDSVRLSHTEASSFRTR